LPTKECFLENHCSLVLEEFKETKQKKWKERQPWQFLFLWLKYGLAFYWSCLSNSTSRYGCAAVKMSSFLWFSIYSRPWMLTVEWSANLSKSLWCTGVLYMPYNEKISVLWRFASEQ
jgi:hypothetical protein